MREVMRPQSEGSIPGDPQTTTRWKWYEPTCYCFPRRWHRVYRAEGMTLRAHHLLLGLMAHVGWENQVVESLAIVAREVGIGKRTVPRVLRILEDARLIAVDRSKPTLLRITISPFLVWQGRPHKLYKARKAFEERCRLAQRQRRVTPSRTAVPG